MEWHETTEIMAKWSNSMWTHIMGIDLVLAGNVPCKQVEQRGYMWTIDTEAGFPTINRLTLAWIDVDPPEIETFKVARLRMPQRLERADLAQLAQRTAAPARPGADQ